MSTMLENARKMILGDQPPAPMATLIGMRLVAIEPGRARFELNADHRHHNPMGTLHGGILCDIADSAMGMAYASTLEDGESFTTLELKINFLRPIRSAHLVAEGTLVATRPHHRHGRVLRHRRARPVDREGDQHLPDPARRAGEGSLSVVAARGAAGPSLGSAAARRAVREAVILVVLRERPAAVLAFHPRRQIAVGFAPVDHLAQMIGMTRVDEDQTRSPIPTPA